MASSNQSLGPRIKAAIAKSGITKRAIAEKLEVTQQAIYGWETTGRISKEKLAELSDLLDVPIQQLLGIQEPAPTSSPAASPDTAQTQTGQASESERLDDDKLNRAIWFLERQFANFGREFVAAGNGDLIAGVYARIGSGAPDNVIKVSRWLLEEIEKGDRLNVGERRAGKS